MSDNISISVNGKLVCHMEFLSSHNLMNFIEKLDNGTVELNWKTLYNSSKTILYIERKYSD